MVPLNIVSTDLTEDTEDTLSKGTPSKYLQVKLYIHYTNIRMPHSPINYNLHCYHSKFRMSQIYSISSYYEKILATGEVKCIDEEVPFEIPVGWEWCRICHVAEIARGGSPRPIKEYITDATDGINWIKIGDTKKDSKYITSAKERIKQSGVSKSRMVHKGDFLLTNSMSFGRPYITQVDGCIHDGWLVISLMEQSYRQDFFYYLLSSGYAYSQFAKRVAGAVVQNLNSEKVAISLFPLPPYKEQNRIVQKIKDLLPLVEKFGNDKTLLDKLNADINTRLKKSILQEAIQGKLVPQIAEEGTAQELLEQIKAEKQKLVKEGKLKKSAFNNSVIFRGDDNKYYEKIGKLVQCIDEEIPFEIPESWVWCKFQDIANSELGKTMNKASDKGGEVPYLCSINVYWDKVDLSNVKVAPFSIAEKEKYLLQKGDLLICEGGEAGRCAIWSNDKTMYYQNALHRVRFYGNISSIFIQNVIRIYKTMGIIDKKSKGMTIKHFTKTALNSLYVPLPPVQEQQRIVAQIEKLFGQLR